MGEWMQKMMTGDVSAFEKWMDDHSASIERFAIQYGCTREQARKVTEESFRSFYMDLEKMDDGEQLQLNLYRIALTKLASIQQVELLEDGMLPFEEDRELHEKIITLGKNRKQSLVLSQFHKMTEKEIAMIIGIPSEGVKDNLEQALCQLAIENNSVQLSKQLEFLEKSYGRIRPSFRKEQVFADVQEQVPERRKSKKWKIVWGVGITIFLTFIAASIVTSEEYQRTSAEKYIERLNAAFEEEIGNRFTELGLTESTKEVPQELYEFTYGQQARYEFKMMARGLERQLKETGTIDKKNANEQFDDIVKKLTLPAEMAEQLIQNPLTDDKEQSEAFMTAYLKQFHMLQEAYSTLLFKYAEKVDFEQFMDNKDMYPEELQRGLEGMVKQNIYPTIIPEWGTVISTFQKNAFSSQMRVALHEDLGGYLTHLESSPFIYYPNLAHPYDESVEYLLDMEKTAIASKLDQSSFSPLDYSYTELLHEIVVGSEPGRIFDVNGKVKAEVQSAWKKIASNGGDSPAAFILTNIVSEMEASGWTVSECQKRLTMDHIWYALELAKEGQLHTIEMSGIIQVWPGQAIVSFPDAQFERSIEKLYELFASNHDKTVLQDAHPLVIFALVAAASEHDDPEMIEHFYQPDSTTQTFDESLNEWEKSGIDLSKIDRLRFNELSSGAGYLIVEQGKESSFNVQMEVDKDGVWIIKHIVQQPTLFD